MSDLWAKGTDKLFERISNAHGIFVAVKVVLTATTGLTL